MDRHEDQSDERDIGQKKSGQSQSDQATGGCAEPADQASVGPELKWDYREKLGIHDRMTEVVKLSLDAAKAELEATRKKLRKLQYGSRCMANWQSFEIQV